MSASTRKQKRIARRLAKAQRKLARRRPGSRRYARAKAVEVAAGKRFDRVMAPKPKLKKVRAALAATEKDLASEREANLARARAALGDKDSVTTVYG
jgi:hypothetical protein